MKKLLKKIIPGWIIQLLRPEVVYRGSYSSWSNAEKLCSGYHQDNILQKVSDATEKVIAGEAVFERDSVLFYHEEYNWPLVNALLKAAEENQGELCVLDFGGALGSTYFQNRKQLSSVKNLKWCIVEQDNFVRTGIERFQTAELCFYKDIDSCVKENDVNTVLLSGVLLYLENPYDVLERLKKMNSDYIIVDLMPVLKEKAEDRLSIQYVPTCIYKASYPIRFLAEENLLTCMGEKYDMQEKFDSPGGRITLTNPREYAFFMGYIFKRKEAG